MSFNKFTAPTSARCHKKEENGSGGIRFLICPVISPNNEMKESCGFMGGSPS